MFTRVEEQFRTKHHPQLDQIQTCLIDNIWNIPTVPEIAPYKIIVINALTNYFVYNTALRTGSKHNCYAILTGEHAEVYASWKEIQPLITREAKRAPHKGLDSIEEEKK